MRLANGALSSRVIWSDCANYGITNLCSAASKIGVAHDSKSFILKCVDIIKEEILIMHGRYCQLYSSTIWIE